MSKFVRPAPEGADPFGTARLRRGVLDAWATSPARFREDANAEEDLVLGGYRDRLVVELAQNAADAAARAGVPGRLRLTLRDGVLVAANTGAPLDAAGVESLSTLRASAKRESQEQAVGRFGVGFAAVLSVTDEPALIGRHGGVRWSLAEARGLAADTARHSPGLGDEVRRRDGHVPLLRLPFAAEGTAPAPYDTAVILPLRDDPAAALAERLLHAVDDALLLALPGLDEVVVEVNGESPRTITRRTDGAFTVVDDSEGGVTHWRTAVAHGPLTPDLLADRPVEERLRPRWSVTWAVPVDSDGSPARPRTSPVVHAPTPSDEPLGVPALLIASFPLDSTRRHAAPGPLTDFLVQRAADAYAELLGDWRPVTTGIIGLVPGPLGKGELDGALRQAILERLPRTSFLPPAAEPQEHDGDDLPDSLRPRDAEIVEGAGADTVRVLAEVLPTLLPGGLERRAELRTLGVARVPLTDAVDRLAGLEKDPGWWRRLYDSLAGVDPDRLSGLPVPLADGRTTIGPRQVLLPGAEAAGIDPEVLARLGLKVAHPDAAHPLLEKLGALPATPRAVLTTPQVRAAVAASLDDEGGVNWEEDTLDADELADTVLALVRDAGLEPGDEPWLGALALPDEDGEPAPACELVFPGGPFAQVMREGELAAVDAELAGRWGEQPLAACGVLVNFALVRATDVVLDPDELEPREGDFAEPDDAGLLDAVDVWCEDILDRFPDSPVPPVATEIIAVRDLDLVDEDKWAQALALLSQPPYRDAIVEPVRILLHDGTHEVVRPYAAWWLRGNPVLDGRRPAGLRAAGGDPLLRGLYEEADATGFEDEQVLRALGVRTSVTALLDEPGGAAELLDRLAEPEREVADAQLHALYGALADLDPEQVTLPDELRAVVDGRVEVVDAADAVVVDSPDLLPFTSGVPLLPVRPARAAELSELFQVRRLSESVTGQVGSGGVEHDVPDPVRVLLGRQTPSSYVEHEELVVDDVEIDWRLTNDGTLHAATLEGVAAGLAWAAGQWPRRFEVAALLEDPSRTEELERDRWFD
ncbi:MULTISPECIES: sacsin N-terminal ATP-binding-like domain-containing protein [Streptomyces]|uniref:Molecular chaperone Hsp90 n=1 Tax=Streptomyces koelreuteriae TaxID=2838015 RepID=A0ABX8FUL2_9ACTN|nr:MULTISPECIES: molecular chaperone Hsp90 [Streptomyces]QWB24863.1 molecular chaperone Hsp90 [Streptomyces koelreuteriae]UUA07879.1 molecular chaperone Hsp90 [Streptomyces koelreuteriae]UUA15508.1 molecular chaperone Hsp90 [Streptomyces sp. CRCS-T-1]